MKKKLCLLVCISLAGLFLVGCSMDSLTPGITAEDITEENSKSLALTKYYGTIKAVDYDKESAIIVAPSNGSAAIKHLVTSKTRIYLNGGRTSLQRLRPGYRITVKYIQNTWNEAIYLYGYR